MCDRCVQVCNTLGELLFEEGSSVTLFADNREIGEPANAIEVCAEWTGWQPKRVIGESTLIALKNAVEAKNRHYAKTQPTAQKEPREGSLMDDRKARFLHAVEKAKRLLKPGDRIRVTKCPGTKRWITFDHWDGDWIVSKSGIDDYSACTIDRLNGEPVDFCASAPDQRPKPTRQPKTPRFSPHPGGHAGDY